MKPAMADVLLDPADVGLLELCSWYTWRGPQHSTWYVVGNKRGSNEQLKLHREVMGCSAGDGLLVDHRNGNGLDNRRSNLRVCSNTQNMWNTGPKAHNTSGYKGVSWHDRAAKWRAEIRIGGGKRLYLGLFGTPEEAHAAYAAASAIHHGEFANTGRK